MAIAAQLLLSSANHAHAQNISGAWQAQDQTRHALKLTRTKGGWRANFYDLDQDQAPMEVTDISIEDGHFKMTVSPRASQLSGTFEGALASDGRTITGAWKQSKKQMQFNRVDAAHAWPTDPSPHQVRLIKVPNGVTLEVLDWGGNGTPLIFLPGLGNTAHVFDEFAPHFLNKHHVYAISRRGTGASSMPPPTDENYNADRLGDDVLAMMAALHINKAFLAGHSIGGQELSSIGTRRPEKALGLIYLDASYNYAFYNSNGDTLTVDVDVMRRDLIELPVAGVSPIRSRALIKEMLETVPDLVKALKHYNEILEGLPEYPPIAQTPLRAVMSAIDGGSRKYGPVSVPALAIIAVPPACQPTCNTPSAKAYAEGNLAQADAYEVGNPQAKIVRLPYADHYVFRSNETEVEREMNAFMDGQGR